MKVFCIFSEKKFDLMKTCLSLHHETTAILPTKKNQKIMSYTNNIPTIQNEVLNSQKDSILFELNQLSKGWNDNAQNKHQLDATWVAVIIPKKYWRIAKELGAKKDGFHGYILWSSSTNDSGYNFYDEVKEICGNYEMPLNVKSMQL